ncbi:unnamed protein product [Scytosiphon promiscuus]
MAAAASTHSSNNSSMIDMSDIQAALEMVKGGSRADSTTSLVSCASHGTSAPTPPSTSPQQLSSGNSSPCGSVRRGGFDENEVGCRHGRPAVRWSDECGLDLVTRVQTATDFWDELVFGPSGCTCAASDNNGIGGAMAAGDAGTTASGRRCECEGCGGEGQRRPGELFQFIEELSRGVEATLLFPSMGGMSKKRRPVILYTEDNGESICWIKTGGAAGSSKEPYRIRCKTLLAVKDKSGAGTAGGNGLSVAAGAHGAAGLEGGGTSTATSSRSRAARAGGGGVGRGSAGGLENQGPLPPRRLSDSGDESEECGAAAAGGGGGGGGESPGVRIKLKWLPQPTWSKRSVKISDVKTRCPGMFTRGMLQLLSFNTELQS